MSTLPDGVRVAVAHRLARRQVPGCCPYPESRRRRREGALITYGPNRLALFRRAAYYADRILKGAKSGDLPIEQPTKLDFVINMKTAKLLGLDISRDLAVRADRIIEYSARMTGTGEE